MRGALRRRSETRRGKITAETASGAPMVNRRLELAASKRALLSITWLTHERMSAIGVSVARSCPGGMKCGDTPVASTSAR